MLRPTWALGLIFAHFANARTTEFSATCPTEWSVDTQTDVVRCLNDQTWTTSDCHLRSCSGFPVCDTCVNVATQEKSGEVTCRKGFQITNTGSTCIDKNQQVFKCSGVCQGTLSCKACSGETVPLRLQRQKRANTLVMAGGCPDHHGFGGLDW